jgi:hypothetical protein
MKGVCMYNKDVQSELFTADAVISKRPCWLHYAQVVPSGGTTDTYLYDGQNTNGKRLIALNAAVATVQAFSPAKPVLCKQGLYVDIGTNCSGVFVQWEAVQPAVSATPVPPPPASEG